MAWIEAHLASPPDPSPRLLQAMLRRTTEHLAHELASPTPTRPDWSPLEWRMACAASAIHGVSSLLSGRLRWEGPADWEEFLRGQRTHTMHRHGRLMSLLIDLDTRLQAKGIAAVALKGATLHALRLYRPGERPMADLDILVRESDREATGQVLEGLGLTPWARSWKEQVFAGPSKAPADALGEHSGRALKIELHTRICEKLPWRLSDITRVIFPADAQAGLNGYPSLVALMAHLLMHAAGNMAARSLRLIQLQDLALLAPRMSPQDWRGLVDLRQPGEGTGPWWALPPLLLTTRYHRQAVPQAVLEELGEQCHWWLRTFSRHQRLSDVSHTRLWVDAFPGLEWSRSLRELVSYMHRRVSPDAATLASRTQIQGQQDWGAHNPWCQLTQPQRMWRWLTRRPIRPPSLHIVRLALAGGQ